MPHRVLADIFAADAKFERQQRKKMASNPHRQRPQYTSDDEHLDEFDQLLQRDKERLVQLRQSPSTIRKHHNMDSSVEGSPPPPPFATIGRSTTYEEAPKPSKALLSPHRRTDRTATKDRNNRAKAVATTERSKRAATKKSNHAASAAPEETPAISPSILQPHSPNAPLVGTRRADRKPATLLNNVVVERTDRSRPESQVTTEHSIKHTTTKHIPEEAVSTRENRDPDESQRAERTQTTTLTMTTSDVHQSSSHSDRSKYLQVPPVGTSRNSTPKSTFASPVTLRRPQTVAQNNSRLLAVPETQGHPGADSSFAGAGERNTINQPNESQLNLTHRSTQTSMGTGRTKESPFPSNNDMLSQQSPQINQSFVNVRRGKHNSRSRTDSRASAANDGAASSDRSVRMPVDEPVPVLIKQQPATRITPPSHSPPLSPLTAILENSNASLLDGNAEDETNESDQLIDSTDDEVEEKHDSAADAKSRLHHSDGAISVADESAQLRSSDDEAVDGHDSADDDESVQLTSSFANVSDTAAADDDLAIPEQPNSRSQSPTNVLQSAPSELAASPIYSQQHTLPHGPPAGKSTPFKQKSANQTKKLPHRGLTSPAASHESLSASQLPSRSASPVSHQSSPHQTSRSRSRSRPPASHRRSRSFDDRRRHPAGTTARSRQRQADRDERSRSVESAGGHDLRRRNSRHLAITSSNSSLSSNSSSVISLSSSSSSSSTSLRSDLSIVWLEHRIPGKQYPKQIPPVLANNDSQAHCVLDYKVKRLQLESGKWRRSVCAWRRQVKGERESVVVHHPVLPPMPEATGGEQSFAARGVAAHHYRRSVYQSRAEQLQPDEQQFLHPTNDGCQEKRHLVADLSARLSSVLSFHRPPATQPEHHPSTKQHLHVHFNDQSDRSVVDPQRNQSNVVVAVVPGQADAVEAQAVVFDAAARADGEFADGVCNGRGAADEQKLVVEVLDNNEARNTVLHQCGQEEPLPFEEVFTRSDLRNCRKIGEGVYGEVFLRKAAKGAVVLKIIPIEGAAAINGEPQKRFAEIISEIIITRKLSGLRSGSQNRCAGFVELLKVHCVRGRWPERLVELWELYEETSGTENDHPEVFDEEQLFIVLELANAGQDLEAFEFGSAEQALAALKQVTLTLAVAEEQLQFEHRDLHWGNILLAKTSEPYVTFRLRGRRIVVPSGGLHVTIIDYTLSRINYEGAAIGNVLFADLAADEELFGAGGDYQFDIYRMMRTLVRNVWRTYNPHTNVMWLHYVCDKLVKGARYPVVVQRSPKHLRATGELTALRDLLFDYASAAALVLECGPLGLCEPEADDDRSGSEEESEEEEEEELASSSDE